MIAGEPVELPNGRVVSRSMDNRLGCYVAYEAARLVAEAGGAPGDVVAVAVAQEEITFGGARDDGLRAATRTSAIAVDVTHATDAPGIDAKEVGAARARQRAGARRAARRCIPRSSSCCTTAAEAEGIPFTVDRRRARHGHRRRRHSTSRRGGIPTAVVSIPLRYMHSPVEMVQLDDVERRARG